MLIIGCDFHPGSETVAIFDNRNDENEEPVVRELRHPQEAVEFYRSVQEPALVGIEAGSPCAWFRRLLADCGHQLWVGDAARIAAQRVGKKKTNREDALLILRLLRENRFPQLWVPTEEERDVRQLLMDRHHRMRTRTRTKNQLQALAMNQGVQKGRQLWTVAGRQLLADLPMLPYAAARRDQLLTELGRLDEQIAVLDLLIQTEAGRRPEVARLMTHPGVGPQTALAALLTLGDASRFRSARHVSSYLGLVPSEHSSGRKQRLGHITKQGSSLMRFLLVEAGQTAARRDPQLGRAYRRMCARKGNHAIAKVMVARRLAVRVYWMLRNRWTYAELVRHVGEPESSCGKR